MIHASSETIRSHHPLQRRFAMFAHWLLATHFEQIRDFLRTLTVTLQLRCER
jgi:hypothetical protein